MFFFPERDNIKEAVFVLIIFWSFSCSLTFWFYSYVPDLLEVPQVFLCQRNYQTARAQFFGMHVGAKWLFFLE